MSGSVVVSWSESRRTEFPIEDYRLGVRTTDGDFFRFTPRITEMEGGFGETIASISFHGFHVASKLNSSEWLMDGKVESITALWRLDEYKIIPKDSDAVPCAGVIGTEFHEVHQANVFGGQCMNIMCSRGGCTVEKDSFDELLASRYSVLPIEDGFYRNGDGSIIVKVSNEGFCRLNLENEKPLSLDEMLKNGPWTKVAFVDVES